MANRNWRVAARVVKAQDSDDGKRTRSAPSVCCSFEQLVTAIDDGTAHNGEFVARYGGIFEVAVGVVAIGQFKARKAVTDVLLHERPKTGSGRS